MKTASQVTPLRWIGSANDGWLELLDQRLLPAEEKWVELRTAAAVADAIRDMVVRGAPAIGVTAAYGVVMASRDPASFEAALEGLGAARPTAVNLRWAIDRLRSVAARDPLPRPELLLEAAHAMRLDDIAANVAMGDHGAALLPAGADVLTVCNTGSLATAGVGTALGVIRSAHRQGRLGRVLACETRPYLQGARLTMWELQRDGIPAVLVTDGMPGYLMATGAVSAVIAGADRIAANGDTANKIGTYQLAVLARYHRIPFYIAAPTSTVDLETSDGSRIPIEQRGALEVTELSGVRIAPEGALALHPAFDVTPSSLIDAIITEQGVATSPFGPALARLVAAAADGR